MLHFLWFVLNPPVDHVSRRKTHRQIVSWLAWLAMTFIVVAPFVSRVRPLHADMPRMVGMVGGDCPHATADSHHPATPHRPADATDRCSYCVLLDHQSLLAAHVILHLLPTQPRTLRFVALHEPEVQKSLRQDARPRGPPYLS